MLFKFERVKSRKKYPDFAVFSAWGFVGTIKYDRSFEQYLFNGTSGTPMTCDDLRQLGSEMEGYNP